MSLFKKILSLIAIVSLLTTVGFGIFSVISYYFGPTYDNQTKILENQKRLIAKINTTSENNKNHINLIFKKSPFLNEKLKQSITIEINSFHQYLMDTGFQVPRECPPIGTIAGKGGSATKVSFYNDLALNESIYIGESSINNPKSWILTYAGFVFRNMFVSIKPKGSINDQLNDQWLAWIYEKYFTYSYLDLTPKDEKGMNNWVSAIWAIREIYGKELTDSILYYASRNEIENSSEFDTFFRGKLFTGINVIANDLEMLREVNDVLKQFNLHKH